MIVLKGPTDELAIQVNSQFNYAAAALPWYCSWNISPGTPAFPFGRSFGIVQGLPLRPVVSMVKGVAAGDLEIREITITNTVPVALNAPGPPPGPPPIAAVAQLNAAHVIIYFVDLTSAPASVPYQLFQCVLQPGDVLSYNASPGINFSWSIYDARGQKVM